MRSVEPSQVRRGVPARDLHPGWAGQAPKALRHAEGDPACLNDRQREQQRDWPPAGGGLHNQTLLLPRDRAVADVARPSDGGRLGGQRPLGAVRARCVRDRHPVGDQDEAEPSARHRRFEHGDLVEATDGGRLPPSRDHHRGQEGHPPKGRRRAPAARPAREGDDSLTHECPAIGAHRKPPYARRP